MLTRIHVNGQNLKRNKLRKDTGRRNSVFTVKDYRRNRKGDCVSIGGPSRLVYRPDHPLRSHAIAWIETDAEVRVFWGDKEITKTNRERP